VVHPSVVHRGLGHPSSLVWSSGVRKVMVGIFFFGFSKCIGNLVSFPWGVKVSSDSFSVVFSLCLFQLCGVVHFEMNVGAVGRSQAVDFVAKYRSGGSVFFRFVGFSDSFSVVFPLRLCVVWVILKWVWRQLVGFPDEI